MSLKQKKIKFKPKIKLNHNIYIVLEADRHDGWFCHAHVLQ